MPWHRLSAVPPPFVEKLQVTLTPPAYTRRPAEVQPEGVGHVRGLIGTRVDIAALANKSVSTATLRVKDQERLAVQLGNDGRQLNASFMIGDAGIHSWWLELKDAQGFEDAEPPRFEIRGLQDSEPEIYIELPASDAQVTADAVVPVRTMAKDDLGLKEIRLVYKLEPATEDGEVAILLSQFAEDELPLAHTAEHLWNIADLKPGLGTKIVFHTEATDEFDLAGEFPEGKAPPPHVGRSVMRTLTVISREDKAQEIAQRQMGLLDDLERASKLQQEARNQVDDLVQQLDKTDDFRPEDLDTLKRTEMGQREVASQLSGPANGLAQRARDLADELQNNQINDREAERQLMRIADELGRLGNDHLKPIEQDLTQARKLLQMKEARPKQPPPRSTQAQQKSEESAQTDAGAESKEQAGSHESAGSPKSHASKNSDGRSPKESAVKGGDKADDALRHVSANQAAVLESLAEMLQDLSQWRGEHDAARELSDVVRQQGDLNQEAAELAKKTLTKPAEGLSPQENADLAKLAERQKKLAEQLEQLESKMLDNVENLAGQNPSAAAALKEAIEQSRSEAISGEMRDAAGQIGENRMGQAARSQSEVLRKLRELENTLRHNREGDTEMLVKKLKQAEDELQDLRDSQADLLRKMEQAAHDADPQDRGAQLEQLHKEQQKLQEETARLARRLERLEAHKAAASAGRAASNMQEADENLDQGNDLAADQQQEALDDLEQAQRELARQRRAEEEHLAQEQLARIADELGGMVVRQQSVIDETRRLDELHVAAGKWSRAQLLSLRDLSSAERTLAEETKRIIERLSAAEVFALALRGAVAHMERAVEELSRRETGAPTQQAEEAALKRLAELVSALKPPDENAQNESDDSQGGAGGRQDGPPADGIPTLAQIKMLIVLQRDLSARTAKLQELRGKDGRLPAAARNELEAIAREQGELADLARNLSAVSSPDADDADDRSHQDDEAPNNDEIPKPE
ncbi:MAG TPA: hypothetical protein VKU82_07410 [Planctomycetaceae bacterium]|nr:hypothetical protein [Planctomycetaceae bacterium]